MAETPLAYKAAEVADLLKVTPRTVQRLVRDGVLHPVPHLGHKIRISAAELDRFLNGREES